MSFDIASRSEDCVEGERVEEATSRVEEGKPDLGRRKDEGKNLKGRERFPPEVYIR